MKNMISAIISTGAVPFLCAFILCVSLMALLLPVLRRLKAGQSIREEGPAAHQVKSGTPTMGGISMVAAFCIVLLFCQIKLGAQAMPIILTTLGYAGIGFFDDYIKVVKKRNLGLTAIQKIILQLVIGTALAVYAGINVGTEVAIPLYGLVDFGLLYYPFAVFVLIAMTNAVNLTDGLDGLASSVTSIVALAFVFLSTFSQIALTGITASVCLTAVCLGFLVFNHYPAKVFMGDTGSLALGGALSAIAIMTQNEFYLPLTGVIYVAEALSVIIQVFVFKTQNGRRFFRMAPLHHHFELGGMKETKVVMLFCAVTFVCCFVVVLAGELI